MPALLVFAIGSFIIICSAIFISLTDKRRDSLLSKLRGISPLTEKHTEPANGGEPNYSDVFPPSRRHTFVQLGPSVLEKLGKSAKEFQHRHINYSKQVPDKDDVDNSQWDNLVTPTGFTVEEIKLLGDFPDYAKLSGVPLPSAYMDFNLTRAKPRPYRPLRWEYHQTMCMFYHFDRR